MAEETLARPQLASATQIHVTGGSAAGKSTRVRLIGAAPDLPVHELDRLAFPGLDFHEQPHASRGAAVTEIAASPRWVTEGVFVGWTEPLFEQADFIIWLDQVAWGQSAVRPLLRSARGALREVRKRRGADRFFGVADYQRNPKQLVHVLRVSKEYWAPAAGQPRYAASRARRAEQLAAYGANVLHVSEGRGVEQVLQDLLATQRRTVAP